MKTKKSEKKLELNKTTIAALNGVEMRAVVGGEACTPPTFPNTICTLTIIITYEEKQSTSC